MSEVVKEYPHIHFTTGVNYGQLSDAFKDAMVMYTQHELSQHEWHRNEHLTRAEIERIVVTAAYAGAISHCGVVEVPIGYVLDTVEIVWTNDPTITDSYEYGSEDFGDGAIDTYDELVAELNTESKVQ
jgi:hypothetical protein